MAESAKKVRGGGASIVALFGAFTRTSRPEGTILFNFTGGVLPTTLRRLGNMGEYSYGKSGAISLFSIENASFGEEIVAHVPDVFHEK